MNKEISAKIAPSSAFHMQPVDIIIPFYGEYDKVTRLLESIFNTIRTNRYQITLVDDASPNSKFIDPFKKIPGVVTFRHEEQKGFGAAVNTGVKNTRQPHIVVLQSDTVVEGTTWLIDLGNTLCNLKERGVKMVSPMTNNPVIDDERFVGEKRQVKKNFILGDGYLPMYCFICNRELFKRVGSLSEYPYAGGEAEEYAFRMKKMGFRQGVCGESWVYHEGRGTLSQYDGKTKVQTVLEGVRKQVENTVGKKDIAS